MLADSERTCAPLVTLLLRQRRALGITGGQVAARCGVQHSTVSMWETGYSDPPLSRLVAYAAAVGCVITLAMVPE
jgi:transcriptional regulator with XRE-family HTH domain